MLHSVIRKLRKALLPPESRQELLLRTLYHRFNATRFSVNRQQRKAEASYLEWRQVQARQAVPTVDDCEHRPGVTFLLSIGAGEGEAALLTIQSLRKMRINHWQMIPILGTGVEWKRISAQCEGDTRVKAPISPGQLTLLKLTDVVTDFVIFCTAGDVFQDSLLNYFHAALESSPAADVYYYDCEYGTGESGNPIPLFKPAALSPELMLSVNYLSRSFVRKTSLKRLTGHPGSYADLMVCEFDLLLELIEEDAAFHHIPHLLVTQAALTEEIDTAINAVINSHYLECGFQDVLVEGKGENRHIRWNFGEPSVSLIILNRDHGSWLKTLVSSIFTLTDYPNYSLIVVDNQSTETEVIAYYAELEKDSRVKIVPFNREFNYSTAINIGVAHSDADVVVLLNNDMQVTDPRWLSELVQWALHPGIGVVGAKLLHKNHSIQHAGIILGMNGFIGHLYLNAPEHYHGLAGAVDWYRNFYALTGACQAMRRDLFHQVGGYDERFKLAFGDIDFCLRVVKAGYRNLYNPYASLIHYEGGSRGYETPVEDILLGYDELKTWLEKDDPHFSPNLTYTPIPRCNFNPGAVNDRLANIEHRKQSLISGLKTE